MSSINSRFDLKSATKIEKPPPRLVLYGEPKIGKTTFATNAPDVVLIATEDGALGVDVPRLPTDGKCKTWQDVLDSCKALRDGEHSFKWVVLDTANQAEYLCAAMVCARDFEGQWNSTKGKEGFNAFAKGDKATAGEFRQLLGLLDNLQQHRGMGVILLAHAGLHKSGNALGPDFVKFGGDLTKPTWSLVSGWADQIGYASRDLRSAIREGEKKAKATENTSARWIQFEGGPGMDAGGRVGYEMPAKILLSWEDYEAQLKVDHVAGLLVQVKEILEESPDSVKAIVSKRFGGKLTDKALRDVGKTKLETMIGWLLAQNEKAASNGQKEAA